MHILFTTHDYSKSSLPMVLAPVRIGNNVIIHDNTLIMPNITVSDGVEIKENSFVLKNL